MRVNEGYVFFLIINANASVRSKIAIMFIACGYSDKCRAINFCIMKWNIVFTGNDYVMKINDTQLKWNDFIVILEANR